MDGRLFESVANSADGEVGSDTRFRFAQDGEVISARYAGGAVRLGFLVGTIEDEVLEFRYAHLNSEYETASGRSTDRIEVLEDGRLRLHESWRWDSKEGAGESVLEEVHPDGVGSIDRDGTLLDAPDPTGDMDPTPEDERFIRRAIELARESVEEGNRPFGSLLVHDGEVVMEARNEVLTENDVRRHPELHLAYRARAELDEGMREETTMYTSTEPCPMCAGGLYYAGLERVVYSVSGPEIGEFTDREPPVRAERILEGVTRVDGPVLNEEGRAVHEAFW
jgi:tRNA(Arg) A34 adenosine deaminase TadA